MNLERGKHKSIDSTPAASLQDQGHAQIMDYLNVAEKSKYPAIRAAALELAMGTNTYQQKQHAKLSPTAVAIASVAILAIAGVLCCYFYLHYEEHLAHILTSVVVALALTGIVTLGLISGRLSETSFMQFLKMMWQRFGGHSPGLPSNVSSRIEASAESESSETDTNS